MKLEIESPYLSPPISLSLSVFPARGLLSRGAEVRRVCLYVDASAAAEKEVRRQENQTLWYVYTPFIHYYGGA